MSTNTPTKEELIAQWLPTQAWGPGGDEALEFVGSFHFDDPEGEVGMQTHLVKTADTLFQVPLTYRAGPLGGAEASLVGHMEHTVLGTRWVHDGLADPTFLMSLAGVALTGQGHALGMAPHEGRWYIAPSVVRLQGGGWNPKPVAVDGFVSDSPDSATAVFRNDRFAMTFFRQLTEAPQPRMGLTATWDGQPDPVVLAEINEI